MTDLSTNGAGAAATVEREQVTGPSSIWSLVTRVLGVKTDERAGRVGAKAEEQLGRELAKLPDGWHVLHAVPIGNRGSDIDHVVIGPRGVFTLTTKHHPDGSVCVYEQAVWVNGHSTVYLHNSRRDATRAGTLLTAACAMPVEVRPAIVFVDLAELTIKGTPPDVHITTRRSLRNFLLQQPHRLTPAQVEHIFAVARNQATWQSA